MFAGGEAGFQEDPGAGDLLLRNVSRVVGADLVEDETLAAAPESILKEDEHHQDGACTERDERGGDEEFVSVSGPRKNEEIHRSDQNSKDDENEDEEGDTEVFFPEGCLKGPVGAEVTPQVPSAMPAGVNDGIMHEFDGLFSLEKTAVGEALEAHGAPAEIGTGSSHRILLKVQAVEVGHRGSGVDEEDAAQAIPLAQGAFGSHRERKSRKAREVVRKWSGRSPQ